MLFQEVEQAHLYKKVILFSNPLIGNYVVLQVFAIRVDDLYLQIKIMAEGCFVSSLFLSQEMLYIQSKETVQMESH